MTRMLGVTVGPGAHASPDREAHRKSRWLHVTGSTTERASDALSWLVVCGQCGDDAADNLPAQEHPEVTDAADCHGLHFGLARYRPNAGHNDVELGRDCQPPHAVGHWRGAAICVPRLRESRPTC